MDKLMMALAKAQACYKPLVHSKEDIMPAVQQALSDNGLSICQYSKIDNGETVIVSALGHESGQSIVSFSKEKGFPLSLLGFCFDTITPNMPQDLRQMITITNEQWEEIMRDLDGDPQLAKDIMNKHGITSFRDLPRKDYYKVKDGIKDIRDKKRLYERS